MRLHTFTTKFRLNAPENDTELVEAEYDGEELHLSIPCPSADAALDLLERLARAPLGPTPSLIEALARLGTPPLGAHAPAEPGPARGAPAQSAAYTAPPAPAVPNAQPWPPAPARGVPSATAGVGVMLGLPRQEAPAGDLDDLLAAPTVDRGEMAALAATSPAKAPAPPKAPRASKAAARDVTADVVEAAERMDATEALPEPNTSPTSTEEAVPPATETPAGLPPEVVGARKLRDVLVWLQDQGMTSADEMKEWCARHKASIPALERVGDLDGRIDRTLEVMDMADG